MPQLTSANSSMPVTNQPMTSHLSLTSSNTAITNPSTNHRAAVDDLTTVAKISNTSAQRTQPTTSAHATTDISNSQFALNMTRLGTWQKIQAAEGSLLERFRDRIDCHYTAFRGRMALVPVLRHFFGNGPVDRLSWMAIDRAMKTVPAYPQFLKDQNVAVIRNWQDVPVMTKKNYVEKYKSPAILIDGKVPRDGQMDQSSGTTGEPTSWYRNHHEVEQTGNSLCYALKASMKGHPIILNTFSHGLWATGITVSKSLDKVALVLSVNADLEKAINITSKMLNDTLPNKAQQDIAQATAAKTQSLIQDISNESIKNGEVVNLVIAGYPPFLQKVAEHLDLSALDKHRVKLWAVGGGERMTSARRENLKRLGFDEVRSSYGASDLTVNIGAQDEWDIWLEDRCAGNTALCKELFGREEVPSIFHFDPGSYKIITQHIKDDNDQTVTKDGLLFTQLKQVTCPKINYYLGDEGGTHIPAEADAIFKKHGITDAPRRIHALPMLYVFGRAGQAVTYSGAKVTPDHLQQALSKIQFNGRPLIESIENYALNELENNQGKSQLRFLLEANAKTSAKDLNTTEILQQIIDAVRADNQDFNEAVRLLGRDQLTLLTFDKGQTEQGEAPVFHPNIHTKKQYIFKGDLKNNMGEVICPPLETADIS